MNGESIESQDLVVWYAGHSVHVGGQEMDDPVDAVGPDIIPLVWYAPSECGRPRPPTAGVPPAVLIVSFAECLVRPVQPQSASQKHRHLASGERRVRTVLGRRHTASGRDPRRGQRLDESEEGV